jgi:hypothetical protein
MFDFYHIISHIKHGSLWPTDFLSILTSQVTGCLASSNNGKIAAEWKQHIHRLLPDLRLSRDAGGVISRGKAAPDRSTSQQITHSFTHLSIHPKWLDNTAYSSSHLRRFLFPFE